MSLYSTDLRANTSLLTNDISQKLINSTITTNQVVLDGNTLDSTGSGGTATLLLNGVTLATNSGLASTIGNWSLYQAISTVTYTTGGGTGGAAIFDRGVFNSISTVSSATQALTVSTINGQTIGQFGQNILYRPSFRVSTVTFNASVPNNIITTFANPLAGKTIQGVLNAYFDGTVGTSNSSGAFPNYNAFVSDNNVSPYTPTNAIGGVFQEQFYPIGPVIGTAVDPVDLSIQVPFAFSNSPATLYLIWAEQNQAPNIPTLATNNVTGQILAVIGGGTVSLV